VCGRKNSHAIVVAHMAWKTLVWRRPTGATEATQDDPLLADVDIPEPSLIGFQQFLSLRTVIASDAYAVVLSKETAEVRDADIHITGCM